MFTRWNPFKALKTEKDKLTTMNEEIKTVNITKTVVIHPANLGKKIKFYIQETIGQTYKNTLGVYGYIKDITRITEIKDGEITPNGNGSVNYKVSFDAEIYKLQEGDTVKGIIQNITTFGIYCTDMEDTNNVSTLFVPKSKIEEETFEQYKENDIVHLEIAATRIKNNEYLCVCNLVT